MPARIFQIPMPVAGWDAINRITAIPKDRAIDLVNLIPQDGVITLRSGYEEQATGMPSAAVGAIMYWEGPISRKLFAACDGEIYDITTAGAVGSAAVSSLTNDRWQSVNFATGGTNYLFIVNGADAPRHYNGTTWATPSITGVTGSDLDFVTMYKRRLWFVEKDSTSAWYLATGAIAGAASEFDVGASMSKGGSLVALGRMSYDAGNGPDDFLVFITSQGQAIIYTGTDPASSSTWSLVGTFDIPKPVGTDCVINMAGDLLVLTVTGVISITAAARSGLSNPKKIYINYNIMNAHREAVTLYRANDGWGMVHLSDASLFLLNVPTSSSKAVQHVMNTQTGAWCKFTGFNATVMQEAGGQLYFGDSSGVVYRALSTMADNGANIVARCRCAFSDLGAPGRVKHITFARVAIESEGSVLPAIGINVDYDDVDPIDVPTAVETGSAVWDTAQWDVDVWGGEETPYNEWISVGGIGHVVGAHILFQAKNVSARLDAIDLLGQVGGAL